MCWKNYVSAVDNFNANECKNQFMKALCSFVTIADGFFYTFFGPILFKHVRSSSNKTFLFQLMF